MASANKHSPLSFLGAGAALLVCGASRFFLFFCPFLFFLVGMMGTRRKRETQAKCM
jgi:hypothetical protein